MQPNIYAEGVTYYPSYLLSAPDGRCLQSLDPNGAVASGDVDADIAGGLFQVVTCPGASPAPPTPMNAYPQVFDAAITLEVDHPKLTFFSPLTTADGDIFTLYRDGDYQSGTNVGGVGAVDETTPLVIEDNATTAPGTYNYYLYVQPTSGENYLVWAAEFTIAP